jgi:phosphoribosyl-ATP pyrophosphohydrolase
MKDLIKRHQAATWERGFITPVTNVNDFLDKLFEEHFELVNAYDGTMNAEFIHEAVDLVAVVVNMLTFYGVDFEKEFRKNVELQESLI